VASNPSFPSALNSEISAIKSETAAAQLRANAQTALAAAMDADLAPLRDRIATALALEDDAAMVASLSAIQADLPDLLTKILAKPAAEQVLQNTATAAMLNGLESAAKERKAST
jgi:hypothetical protein